MSKQRRRPKQRIRQSTQVKRRAHGRRTHAKVLIVCEGKMTEVHYFKKLKDDLALHAAHVEIRSDCQSDPLKIYQYATRLCKQETDMADPYDSVYCVFDKDSHGTYQQAMEQITKDKSASTFTAINSVPCFEYWLLLHFTPSTKPYRATPGSSACDQVERELKKHLPDYSKSDDSIFNSLENKLNTAIRNAKRTLREAERNQTDNPSTRVYELVEHLQSIERS